MTITRKQKFHSSDIQMWCFTMHTSLRAPISVFNCDVNIHYASKNVISAIFDTVYDKVLLIQHYIMNCFGKLELKL